MSDLKYNNPYEHLSSDRFWKSAVARPLEQVALNQQFKFNDLWHPKFQLTKRSRFATAGSCFAQHISRWLIDQGYDWIDSEPANGYMNSADRKSGHYGVFSFRTGNIYTAALLKQWIYWSLGKEVMPDEVFEHDGIFYDPFRPSIPTQGYTIKQYLYDDRLKTLSAIRASLEKIDVFIFTLGLTEAWYHAEGKYVYPHCPGTIKGTFDGEKHEFINYNYNQIKEDVIQAFDAIKSVNPHCRFILTVSPVPLTATASDDHVLSATIYSKSVLRAVAGDLKNIRDDVDYFPSYELISAYPIKALFYENNLRSVTQEGVNFVMQHFSGALADYQKDNHSLSQADVFCEELMLQRHAQYEKSKQYDQDKKCCEVLLFGDSQMGKLASAFKFLNVSYIGDHIMDGSQWHKNNFVLDQEEYFIPLQSKISRELWKNACQFFDSHNSIEKKLLPISVFNLMLLFKR